MATLSAWKFDKAEEASMALESLRGLQSQHLVQLADAAVLSWPQDAKGPRVRQATLPAWALSAAPSGACS